MQVLIIIFALFVFIGSDSPKSDKNSVYKTDFVLQKKLEDIIEDFDGFAGVCVMHHNKGIVAGVNKDTLFPSASLIKIPIMLKIFQKIEDGELDINEELMYQKNYAYPHEVDIVNSFEHGTKISVNKLINLMMIFSDNSSSIWLQDIAGQCVGVNDWLNKNGFMHTRINTNTYGREQFAKLHGWGSTTPREMTEILSGIYQKNMVSTAASEKMIRILSRSFWDGEAQSQIPPNTFMISKQGAFADSKSEVVGVQAPSGTYFFCVITDNQSKQGFDYNDSGFVLIRKISRFLYEYFEPQDTWRPSDDQEKYW